MSNFKTMTTITLAALLAAPAFAQDAETELSLDFPADILATDFVSADLDQDGSLNADEFVTFAVMRADGGNETFKDLVMSGDYAASFAAHDTDGSGGVEIMELTPHGTMPENPETMEPEAEDIPVPEL